VSDLAAFFAQHGIEAQRFDHPPVMTVEESERLVPKLPGAKTKNLFLRNKKGDRHFLVTVPHDLVVDLSALGARLGAGRLGFASAERLLRHLGITPGSVSLLALVNDTAHAVEFVIDRRLWEVEAVHAHPLRNDATLVISHVALERFLDATGHAVRVLRIDDNDDESVASGDAVGGERGDGGR
jgi:Ala-tRNA(Pro) deacylase